MISHKILRAAPPPTVHTVAPKLLYTQEELKEHIRMVGLVVGDWVYFRNHMTLKEPDVAGISVVVEIEEDPTKVRSGFNKPKAFLLMQLTGCSEFCRAPNYAFSRNPWCRWDDGVGMVKVTEEHKKGLLDDYVQNYLKEYIPQARQLTR